MKKINNSIGIAAVIIAFIAVAVYAGEPPCGVGSAKHTCATAGDVIVPGTAQTPCEDCFDGEVDMVNTVTDKACGTGSSTNCVTTSVPYMGVWEVKYTRECNTEWGICMCLGVDKFQTTINCQGVSLSGSCSN
jgi:hypothetical protein